MIDRDAYGELLKWKRAAAGKALLVDGARQIGKTFLVEEFAKREYPGYVKVDFLRNTSAARALSRATSAQQVIEALALINGRPVEPGRTLIFLDEVQEAPNVVTFSKYLVQDGRFPLIMSGSLLGVELAHAKSLPVGYLRMLKMYPLSFLEFARALGVPSSAIEQAESCYRDERPVDAALHERLIEVLRLYLVIGGMPEAVESYRQTAGDLGSVRKIQRDLVALYKEDIAKHAGDRVLQVKAIYDALPAQLNKENKRFALKSLGPNVKFERYANDFAWIVGAAAALKTTNVTDPKPMLKRSEEENRFKLYLSDVGMLMSCYRSDVALDALSGERAVNFGGVYENAVAQELAARGVPLHYFIRTSLGEVDFIAEKDGGAVLPIEVKSGKGYKRHVALNNLLRSPEFSIGEAVVLSEANVSSEQREGGKVRYLPLYMLPFMCNELADKGLENVRVAPPTW